MFRKLSNSWRLAKESWAVLRQDSELMIFPVLSVAATIALIASFFISTAYVLGSVNIELDGDGGIETTLNFAFLFVVYFIGYFCVLFCNTALLYCAKMRFDGQDPTIKDGFRAGFSNIRNIAAWAAIGATIGVILAQLEKNFGFVGAIIRRLIGGAWTVITYFAIPVIVFEGVGPMEGLKRSKAIIEKTWGETLTAVVGLNGAQTIVGLTSSLFLIAGIFGAIAAEAWQPAVAGLVLMLVTLIGSSIVFSCLAQIYCAALYIFATTNEPPSAFSREYFDTAFK